MDNYKIYFYCLVHILSALGFIEIIRTIGSLCWECQISPAIDPIQPLVAFALFLLSIFCMFNIYNEFYISEVG